MKKIVPFLFLGVLISSCGTKIPSTEKVDVEIVPRIEIGEVPKKLFSASGTDSLTSTVFYAYYPIVDSVFKDSANAKIQRFIGENTNFSNGPFTEPMSRAFVERQLDAFEESYQTEIKEYGGDYDPPLWSLEVAVSIDETALEYILLDFSTWSYLGGAHGNAFSTVHYIDRKSGKVVKLTDFFTDVTTLFQVGEHYFRLAQGLGQEDDLTEAGFWFEEGNFYLPENFTFSPTSVLFMYNQYEIAPYSAGMIEVEIPMEEIKRLLKRKID